MPQPRHQSLFHHGDTEYAEFGAFLNQKLFTPRPPRLRGEISEVFHCPLSIKSIRRQIHGDAEFALNLFQPHDAPLALNRRLSEVYGESERVADGVGALSLKEDTRGADVTGDPRRSVLKAYGHRKTIPLGATPFLHSNCL